ncbi:MAG: phage portal protein [Akkermansia sp.]|nr:phage portal protein [Akkermansia sp.]
MSRRKKNHGVKPEMYGHYDAAQWSPDRRIPWYPLTEDRDAPSGYELWMLWGISRHLEANYAPVRMAIETRCGLVGYLMPLPVTSDEGWNERVQRHFLQRVQDPELFDVAGAVNWQEAQLLIQRRAIIDGDHLTVLARGEDRGGMVKFYTAPQIGVGEKGGLADDLGVMVDPRTGRALGYRLKTAAGEQVLKTESALLFRSEADPACPRGVPELTAVINDCLDLKDVAQFLKAAIKLSASVALVEEKPAEDARAQAQSAWRERKGVTSGEGGQGVAAAESGGSAGQFGPFAKIAGPQMISLAPGRKLHLVHDTRPSAENQAFAKRLLANLAYNWGFDPEPFFFVNEFASAGARFSLQKLNRRLRVLRLPLQRWCTRVYRHVLACEVAAGRLPTPPVSDWEAVRWVPLPDLTIDRGREVSGIINAVAAGLADADAWTLATEGLTAKQVIERRARNLAAANAAADEYGVKAGNILGL